MACDAACRWMRGTLRAQVRVRSFRTVRLGFLVTSRAPQNTPRVPLKGTRGVLHRAILTEKCHLNPTQHPPTTRYAPRARSQATGALGDPNTPQNELFRPIFTPCLGPLTNGSYAPSRVKKRCCVEKRTVSRLQRRQIGNLPNLLACHGAAEHHSLEVLVLGDTRSG